MPPFDAVHSLVNNWGMGIEGEIPEPWFAEIDRPDFNILEVGFGKGNMLKRLSHENGAKLYGIDCSQTNYRHVESQQKVNAHLSIADISFERMQYPDGHFDVIIMLEVLEHIMSPLHVALEMQRVLKKDGLMIFSWPEERLISGIGKEMDQTKRRYDEGFHSFPNCGMFLYETMRVFWNQLYFKIIDEERKDYHIFFKMINRKVDRPNILDVVNGDYNGDTLYSDIKTVPKFTEIL